MVKNGQKSFESVKINLINYKNDQNIKLKNVDEKENVDKMLTWSVASPI